MCVAWEVACGVGGDPVDGVRTIFAWLRGGPWRWDLFFNFLMEDDWGLLFPVELDTCFVEAEEIVNQVSVC